MELIRKQTVLNMIDNVQFGNITHKLSQLHEAVHNLPPVDAVEVVRCNQCKHYEGVHGVSGNAPCAFWGIGAVMWDDFCKRGEMWDE